MISEPRTVWINGSGKHHASRSCAGQDGVPTFEELLAGEETEPCGLCKPRELVTCDKCDEQFATESSLKRHHTQTHLRGALADDTDTPDTVERKRELDAKARGGSGD